ncbi:MAG: isoprenylcysteine carboxylmethyltransferase family protein [Myxococcales bacterium]
MTTKRSKLSGVLGALRLPAFCFAVLALASGRLDWGRLWLLAGLQLGMMVVNLPIIATRNPELLQERFQKREDTKPFDKVFAALMGLTLLATLVVAGLDAGRYGWSRLPIQTVALGIALHALGDIPVVWALSTNKHLEATVRIQSDREHQVVTWGPYRHVRHPMYTGMLLMFSGWPLILGSAWAYLPLGAFAAVLVWRTSREDKTLQAELAGYAEYASRTRFRLVPHVW